MLLSSVNRLRKYTGMGDTPEETRIIAIFLAGISRYIQETFLERDLELTARTEYFDTEIGMIEYFPKAYPITPHVAVTSPITIHSDVTGLYSGGETLELNHYIGIKGKSIVLWRPLGNYPKGLRITYTGGVATHPVNSVFTLTGTADAPEVATGEDIQWVWNADYSALGVVKAWDAGELNITIENYVGVFKVGDVLTFSAKEYGDPITGTTGTISAIVSQSLVEALPNVALAVENEARYFIKNKDRFETQGTNKDGSSSKRQYDRNDIYTLQQETQGLLWNEKRMWI